MIRKMLMLMMSTLSVLAGAGLLMAHGVGAPAVAVPGCPSDPAQAALYSASADQPVHCSCEYTKTGAEKRVIRLHIHMTSITGDYCMNCVMVGHRQNPDSNADADDTSTDQDDGPFTPAPFATAITYGNGEWRTPFDFNLDNHKVPIVKPSTLVEVILDDKYNRLSFMSDPGKDNSRFALLATPAAVHDNLFDCRRQLTNDAAGHYMKKLRFHINSKLATGAIRSGSLNIGVLVDTKDLTTGSSPKEIYVPLYIDPHPQNGG